MAEIEDNVDRELFRNVEKLRALRIEHRDLDEVISRLTLDIHSDQLQLKRLTFLQHPNLHGFRGF